PGMALPFAARTAPPVATHAGVGSAVPVAGPAATPDRRPTGHLSALALTAAEAPPDLHEYYLAHGYAVVRGVIPRTLIAALLDSYRTLIVPSSYPFFRQNTNAYERNSLTADGYVRQSFLVIHDYARFPVFSSLARDIYCCDPLIAALRQVTGV